MIRIHHRLFSLMFSALLGIAAPLLLLASEVSAQLLNLGDSFFLTQPAAGEVDEAGDEFSEVVADGDFNGDGFGDLVVGAPGEDGESGSVSIFLGAEEGLSTGSYITQIDAGGVNEAGDRFGAALVAGDFNFDGFEDLVVGAPGKGAGVVYIFPGSLEGLTPGVVKTHAEVVTTEAGDEFGAALDAGDFNDDGFEDLVVGAPGRDGKSGAVFVFPTVEGAFTVGIFVTQSDVFEDAEALDPEALDRFGAALAVGDFTGEGFDELVVGAPGEDGESGAVSLFYGGEDGITEGVPVPQSDADETSEMGDLFGAALVAGDLNGDGTEELVVGAPGKDGWGTVFVFPGEEDIGITEGMVITQSDAGGVDEEGDEFGAALVAGGFNDDVFEDLAVGAPGKDGGSGIVFVFSGSEVDVYTGGFVITQTDAGGVYEAGDRFGAALASEDFNDDAGAELAVGAPGEAGSGTVFVLPGVAVSPPAVTQRHAGGVNERNDEFGKAEAVGDFNDDGFEDLAVGAPGKGYRKAGSVFIFLGSEAGITGEAVVIDADDVDWDEDDDEERIRSRARFGVALTVGDFNGDAIEDLAVGAYRANRKAGAVFIFPGSGEGITTGFHIDANDVDWDESDDEERIRERARFGVALTAGDFNGDAIEDLAVGAYRANRKAGAVFIFPGSGEGITTGFHIDADDVDWDEGDDEEAIRDDARFGVALTAGDFNGDAIADLAVGAYAPGFCHRGLHKADDKSGSVFIFPGSEAGITTGSLLTQTDAGEVNERRDRFGAALAAGDFDDDGYGDLAVGAPGERIQAPGPEPRSGMVFIFPGSEDGITTGFFITQTLAAGEYVAGTAESVEVNEDGDEFGAALAVANFDGVGPSDLVVGASGETPGPWPQSGLVFIFLGFGVEDWGSGIRTNFDDLGPEELVSDFNFFYTQTGFGGENEEGDKFGSALVAGDFNGDEEQDLAGGAPGEAHGLDPEASGAVYLIPASELVP